MLFPARWVAITASLVVMTTTVTLQAAALSIDSIRALYLPAFELPKSGQKANNDAVCEIKELPDSNPLAAFVEANDAALEYIASNGRSIVMGHIDPDVKKITNKLLQSELAQDSTFNAAVVPMAARWLQSQGIQVEPASLTGYEDSLWTWEEIWAIGIRFVFVDGRQANGDFQSHFCSGINGIADYPGRKSVGVEAAVFQWIMNDVYADESKIIPLYMNSGRLLRLTSASEDSVTTVLRAQGAMWATLYESDEFHSVLEEGYHLAKSYTPFVIVDDE